MKFLLFFQTSDRGWPACGRLRRQTSARLKITFVDMTYPKGWTESSPSLSPHFLLGGLKGSSNMAAPYWLCNFVRNISMNISALGQHTHLKLGELSSLFIVYNITFFFLLYPLHSFWFYFFIAWQCTHSIASSSEMSCLSKHRMAFVILSKWSLILLEQNPTASSPRISHVFSFPVPIVELCSVTIKTK